MGFYQNYEVRRITIKLILIYILFCFCVYFYTEYSIKAFSKKLVDQNVGVVGTILYKHPDLEEDIIKCYTQGVSQQVKEKGEETLNNYGYGKKTFIEDMPLIKDINKGTLVNNLIMVAIFFFITITIVMREYRYILKKVKKISNAAEKVVEEDFTVKLIEEGEGEFSILANQFNQMSNRLQNSIDSLKKEKNFLKDIISDISHQLKTPLSSLMLFNELFIEKAIKEEDKMNFYFKSKNQLERMEWLIKNLLKIAKIEADSVEFERKENPLIKTVNKALEPLKAKWQSKNQKMILDIDEEVLLKHDVNWTAEGITNIVKNCIEHTQKGGEIRIAAFESPLYVGCTIKDNGPGIYKDDLPHIFERFYKGKKNKNSDSVGIGLALSKSIIEGQEGSIQVQSVENKGTEFTILFLKGII